MQIVSNHYEIIFNVTKRMNPEIVIPCQQTITNAVKTYTALVEKKVCFINNSCYNNNISKYVLFLMM